MRINISKEADKPVYMQIFEQVREQILAGALVPGFQLPPERKLADRLGINRSTVLNAYRELKAEGLVGSRVGQGTVVLASRQEDSPLEGQPWQEPSWNQIFSQYSNTLDSNIVDDLLTLANRTDVISFATGIACPRSGPMEALEGIEAEIVGKSNYKPLLHSPTVGFTSLREALSGFMQKRGVYCQSQEVMLLSGSQQGIDLAAKILLDPGDVVVVEEPSFFPAIQSFKAAGARVMGIPMDDKGMRLDVLEQLLQRYRPKFIYTMPTFQNPTGIEMTLERRKRLLELAYKYRVLLLEDDAYGDLCFEGHCLPTLKSMDNKGYVLYLSTFSKNVYSGLRIGWMIANKKVIQRFAAAKQIMDLHTSTLSQWIVERYIRSGGLEKHIGKMCGEYRVKRDAMEEALVKYAPRGLSWNRPRGGYYIWCRLPEGVSASHLVPKAAEHKVAFVPGTPFFPTGAGDEYIRLNFTFASLKDIHEGIGRLCRAIKELMEENSRTMTAFDLEMNPIV